MLDMKKILVVDDLIDWCLTIAGILQDHGYDCSWAMSIGDAINELEQEEFNLATIDMRLDETDENNIGGIELAKIIRQRWNTINIVILTGYGTPETLRVAMQPDAKGNRLVDDYLGKDEIDKLIDTVRRI